MAYWKLESDKMLTLIDKEHICKLIMEDYSEGELDDDEEE